MSGVVQEPDGKAMKGMKLSGKWDQELRAHLPDGSQRILWRVNPPAADPSRCRPLPPDLLPGVSPSKFLICIIACQ